MATTFAGVHDVALTEHSNALPSAIDEQQDFHPGVNGLASVVSAETIR
jgi:hypothetical protein